MIQQYNNNTVVRSPGVNQCSRYKCSTSSSTPVLCRRWNVESGCTRTFTIEEKDDRVHKQGSTVTL